MAIILGVLIVGEPLTVNVLAGGAVIISAVVVILTSRSKHQPKSLLRALRPHKRITGATPPERPTPK